MPLILRNVPHDRYRVLNALAKVSDAPFLGFMLALRDAAVITPPDSQNNVSWLRAQAHEYLLTHTNAAQDHQ